MGGDGGRLKGAGDGGGNDAGGRFAATDVQVRPVQRAEVHAALQLILGANGRPASEEHVVDFLRYAVYRQLDLNDIWLAARGNRLVWAILPVISPGKTMLLFSPTHVPADEQDTCVCPLVERVLEHYQTRAVELAQVLLDPGDAGAVAVFKSCRFEPLAELIYLDREVHGRGTRGAAAAVAPPDGFAFEPYAPAMHATFARAVAATYEGSLDCPRLNGRRSIDDVLEGHKAAGEFDPKLWFLLRDDGGGGVAGAAAGVVLLNRSTRTDSLELVYLGLAPHYRGKKLGDLLMRHALATAASIGSRRLSLAVDSMNVPALRLYQRHGMTKLCSRLALLRDLRDGRVGREVVTR